MTNDPARHSIHGLSRSLGRARNTIRRYLAMPGSPRADNSGRYDAAEVESYIKSQGGDFYADRGPIPSSRPTISSQNPDDWTPARMHTATALWLMARVPKAAAGKTQEQVSAILHRELARFFDMQQSGTLPSLVTMFEARQGRGHEPKG